MLHRSSDLAYLKDHRGFVVGCDEAGRGPLAGPVVAAAVLITDNAFEIEGICDSKATKEAERDALYDVITSPAHSDKIIWAAQVIDHDVIDEINILEASLKAMREAAENVLEKAACLRKINPENCIGLIDGNKIPANFPCEASFVIKGDSKVYSIAMASIIAKVTRDKIMVELDKQYPIYNLAKHKGYPTLEHRQLLSTHGPSKIHRRSYTPVRLAYEKHGGYIDDVPVPVATSAEKSKKKIVKSKSTTMTDALSVESMDDISRSRDSKLTKLKVSKSIASAVENYSKNKSKNKSKESAVAKKKVVSKAKTDKLKTSTKIAAKKISKTEVITEAKVSFDVEAAIKNFVSGIIVEVDESSKTTSKKSPGKRSNYKAPSNVESKKTKMIKKVSSAKNKKTDESTGTIKKTARKSSTSAVVTKSTTARKSRSSKGK
jgi:ribonuclease HII